MTSGLDPSLKSKYKDLYRKLALKLQQDEGILTADAPAEVNIDSFYIDCKKYANKVKALNIILLSIVNKIKSIINIASKKDVEVSPESIPKQDFTIYIASLENEILELEQKFDSIEKEINNLDLKQKQKLAKALDAMKEALKNIDNSVNISKNIASYDANYEPEYRNLESIETKLSNFVSYFGQTLNSKNIR